VFDPSVLVKGWAVERAALLLDQLGVREYCLTAGANVAVRAAGDGAPAWWVEIEDPSAPARVLAVLPLMTGGVATAGDGSWGTPGAGRSATLPADRPADPRSFTSVSV